MYRKYFIELTEAERQHLEKLTSSGETSARALTHAHSLLKSYSSADGPNWKYDYISAAYNVTHVTIMNVRKPSIEGGLEAALYRKRPDREYQHALNGDVEAHLIAIACGERPEGQVRWSLRLLRNHLVRSGHVDHFSHETIRTTFKK
jgi:hypothetical protein